MDFIKKNKLKLGIGLAFVILMIIAIFGIIDLVYPDKGKSLYGNRLDGIKNVPISDTTINKIKEVLEDTNKVKSVSYDLKGKLGSFIIDVKKGTDIVSSESLSDKILSNFSEKEKNYYDFQIFITCNEDEKSEIYPIIGYRHKTSLNFKWTNN